MKNLAKLALFFSLSFAIVFVAATGIRFLSLRVEWAQNLPQKPETSLTILIAAAHWALSLAMYTSILLGMSYAVRRRYYALMAVLCVMVLSLLFNLAVSFALYHWQYVPPAHVEGRQMGRDGLILSNSLNRNETAVVLLRGTADPMGPRVTAIPDRPLLFQESTANTNIGLPPIPFGDDSPWFYKSLIIDIRLSGEQIHQRFNDGLLHYFIYTVALIFLLSSLGYVIKFSVWPLANLFLGIIAFRGILAIETFFNTPEMQELFDSFFKKTIPVSLAVPLIFLAFGLLITLYEFLVSVAKRRDEHDF